MTYRVPIRNNCIPEAKAIMARLLSDFARDKGLVARCSAIRGFDVGVELHQGYINLPGPFYVFDERGRHPQNPIIEISVFDDLRDVPGSHESDFVVDGVLVKLEDEQRPDLTAELFRRISGITGMYDGVGILSVLAKKLKPCSDAEYDRLAASLDSDKDYVRENIKKDFATAPEIFYDSPFVAVAGRHGLNALEAILETMEERKPAVENKWPQIKDVRCDRFDTSKLYFYDRNGLLAAEVSVRKGGAHTYHNRDWHFREIKFIDRAHQEALVRDFLNEFDITECGGEKLRADGQYLRTELYFGRLVYTDITDTEGKSVPVTHRNLSL